MESKIEQFPAKNPNPVLSVGMDGTVLYSNVAGEPLLHEWGVNIGEKLPFYIVDFVQKIISQNSPEKKEVKVGKRVYLVVFHPLPEQECVNISGFDISDRIELEEKPRESEALEMMKLELTEVFDVHEIQSLMNEFYKLTHIPIGIIDLNGNVLVGVGWQEICTRFHRVHPKTRKHCIESDTILSSGVPPGKFKPYKCKNNMWDIVTPIIAGGRHIGNIFLGQFFFEGELLDYELFRSQARLYGFNEEEYITALEKVPRLTREYVDTIMSFFMKLASMISKLSYSNIKLLQSLAERSALVGSLRESEGRYRMLFDHSMDGIILSDPNESGKILSANPAACRMLGWSEKELIGKGRDVMFDLEDPAVSYVLDRLKRSGSAKTQLTYKRKNGTKFPGDVSASLFADSNGETRTVVIIRDITERKKAEEALKNAHNNLEKLVSERTAQLEKAYKSLKKSEEGFAEAQKIAHIGNWEWDIVTGKTYWSDELYRIYGRNSLEPGATYDELLNYIHPDDRDYVAKAINSAFNGKSYGGIDYRIILADGEERTLYAKSEVIFDEENIPILVKGTNQDITERKKVEEKIKILADAVESSDDAIVTETQDGIVTSWNKGAEQIYGYSAEEVLGINASILEPENIKGEIKQLIKKVQEGEKIRHFETSRLRKDGTILNASVTISPIFDKSGNFKAVSCITKDITESIKAQEALRLSNIYNRSLFEASLDPLVTIGHDGKITDLNTAMELATSYSRNELIGTDFTNYFTEPEKARDVYQKAFMEGFISDYILEILNRNGSTTPILSNASVYKDESGGVIGVFVAARDITDRLKAQEKIQILASVVESSSDAIGTISLEGTVTSWNKGAEQVYGYSAGEALGKPTSFVAPSYLDNETKQNIELIKQGGSVSNYQTLRLRNDGKTRDVSITLSPVYDLHRKLIAISFISRDVTERKIVEEKLRESEEKYRNIVETANEGILIIDDEARVTFANKKLIDMLGYTLKEGIGKPVMNFTSEKGKVILETESGK